MLHTDKLKHAFTAHPKVDPETQELIFFGYTSKEPVVRCSVVDAEGTFVRTVAVPLHHPAVMMHDCAITSGHTLILDFPLPVTTFALDKTQMSRFGCLPRHATSPDEIVWIEAPAMYAFHIGNSWEEVVNGDTIITVICGATGNDYTLAEQERRMKNEE